MARTNQHEIEDNSKRVFLNSIPLDWVPREQHPDYGEDYFVEIFDYGNSIGKICVQLKAGNQCKETEDSISVPVKVENLIKYRYIINDPVYIVAVTNNNKVYGVFFQKYCNEVIEQQIPNWKNQKTVAIKIPKTNIFPEYCNVIKNELLDNINYIYILLYSIPKWSDVYKVSKISSDPYAKDELLKIHLKSIYLEKFNIAEEYFNKGDVDRSKMILFGIKKDTYGKDELINECVYSFMQLVSLHSIFDKSERQIIIELSKECTEYLKEKLNFEKEKLYLLCKISFSKIVYYNELIYNIDLINFLEKDKPKPYQYPLYLQKNEFVKQLLDQKNEYSNLMMKVVQTNDARLLSEMLWHSLNMSIVTLSQLISLKMYNIDRFIEDTNSLLKFFIDFSTRGNDINHLIAINFAKFQISLLLKDGLHEEILNEIRKLSEITKNEFFLKKAESILTDISLANEEDISNKSSYNADETYTSLRKHADLWGYSKEDDSIENEAIGIGLKDFYSIIELYKSCSEIEINILPSPLGGMVKIPTIGRKTVFCRHKKENTLICWSLENFKNDFTKHCIDCHLKSPLPENWEWDTSWQTMKDQNVSKEFIEFLRKQKF